MPRLVSFAGLAAGLAALAGCARPAAQPAPVRPPEVVVGRPVNQAVTEYEDFTGRTDAVNRVELRSRVTGYLEALHFKDGTDIKKKGDLLFTIDPRTYQAEAERTDAAVAQAQALLTRLDKDFARTQSLRAQNVITVEEADKVGGDRAEARAAVAVTEAARKLARQNLEFTRVTAPFPGRISRRAVDPGNLVKADDTLLSEIVQLDPMAVNFDVDDRTLLRIRRLVRDGKITSAQTTPLAVKVALPDRDTYDIDATVDFIDTKVDPGSGTLRVRAEFKNPTALVSPGLFVRVRLPVGSERPAVLVPEVAIGTDQGEKFVFVVNTKDEVEYRPVKLGMQYGALREVMPKDPVEGAAPRPTGVTDADRVVVVGLQRVRAGAKVTVKDPAAPAKSDAAAATPPTAAPRAAGS